MSLRRYLKDPLVHFLVAGAILFLAVSAIAPPEEDDSRIVVDRGALISFVQYRSKAFEPAAAAALLDGLSDAALARLIADYIEEEVLAREAEAMGLAAGDYVIRQRMVQKAGFAIDAVAAQELNDDEARAFFEANRERYVEQPSATFAHVFFSRDRPESEAQAAAIAAALNAENAPFEAALLHGDRFPFHTNYVERTYDYVASQFGDEAARAIFDPDAAMLRWRGPLVSSYGAHAVFVARLAPARPLDFEEVAQRVRADAHRDKHARARDALLAETIERYDVVIADDIRAP
jgi:hypothetical protein